MPPVLLCVPEPVAPFAAPVVLAPGDQHMDYAAIPYRHLPGPYRRSADKPARRHTPASAFHFHRALACRSAPAVVDMPPQHVVNYGSAKQLARHAGLLPASRAADAVGRRRNGLKAVPIDERSLRHYRTD